MRTSSGVEAKQKADPEEGKKLMKLTVYKKKKVRIIRIPRFEALPSPVL
ncbi:hypothetical protein [Cellvibrio polysaccharolyticus]|nr:hypothetical protein [Cellvibrio polysaccharolyticus]